MSWFVYLGLGYDGGMIKTFEKEEEARKEFEEAENSKSIESCGLIQGKLIEGVIE